MRSRCKSRVIVNAFTKFHLKCNCKASKATISGKSVEIELQVWTNSWHRNVFHFWNAFAVLLKQRANAFISWITFKGGGLSTSFESALFLFMFFSCVCFKYISIAVFHFFFSISKCLLRPISVSHSLPIDNRFVYFCEKFQPFSAWNCIVRTWLEKHNVSVTAFVYGRSKCLKNNNNNTKKIPPLSFHSKFFFFNSENYSESSILPCENYHP